MTPVRLEPAALRSRVKHSTTEPLRSHCILGRAAQTICIKLKLGLGKLVIQLLDAVYRNAPLHFIKLPFAIKVFVLSIFEWPFYTGFTVQATYTM